MSIISAELLTKYLDVSVNYKNTTKCDMIVYNSSYRVIFLSLIGYNSVIKEAIRDITKTKETVNVSASGSYYRMYGDYKVVTKKAPGSDYVHAMIYLQDSYTMRYDQEEYSCYIYGKTQDEMDEQLYQKITKYSSIPVLKEWMPYLKRKMIEDRHLVVLDYKRYIPPSSSTYDLTVYNLTANKSVMLNLVQEGLQSGAISIEGSNAHSLTLDGCRGIDNYLQLFGEGLAKKIQESFKAKFTPGEDEYDAYLHNIDDYVYHNVDVNLYEAQRSTIQAVVNNMRTNKNTIIVGEMGSGKTLMSSSSCYVHHANKLHGFNALVLCPSHLVENWKNEVERFIPNGRAYIIHNLEELLELENKLKDPFKVENTFVILSKERAKIGYGNRPAVLFKRVGYYTNEQNRRVKAKNVFVCPECGQVLTKEISVQANSWSTRKVKRVVPMELQDFTKEYTNNEICNNIVYEYNSKTETREKKVCGNKLWTAINRDDEGIDWIKLGKSGWVHKDTIEIMMADFLSKDKLDKKDADFFSALSEQYNSIKTSGETIVRFKGTKKYPIASYINKRMNDVFDYGIFDELQNYKGQTDQGHAFHLLTKSCKYTLNMTGTLMNGMVNSMYYLLYRLYPEAMRREGFKYEDEVEFNRLYGVYSNTSVTNSNRRTNTKTKLLPGISSLVFTKFLMNNTVFVSLEDMAEGLPNYTEIPYSVTMDSRTATGYSSYENFFNNMLRGDTQSRNRNFKYSRAICKNLLTYPDAPFDAEEVYNDENRLMYAPNVPDEFTTNKDLALMEIIRPKIEAGEKILVYYNDVGVTCLGKHLTNLINSHGYNAAELTSSVKAEKRESYINDKVAKGLNVLICNPALVETGLNLLDFTTIVFYQLGYNLNTMRQASRRSWRLSQKKDITVYFLYYQNTVQEGVLSLMATKLHAAQSMEGKFSEEGLRAMSNNQDVLTQIASNVVDGIKDTVDDSLFRSAEYIRQSGNMERPHYKTIDAIEIPMNFQGRRRLDRAIKANVRPTLDVNKTKNIFKLL